ncbi:MAG: amidinotransferase [Bacteroidetes bacterium]|nr:amidinotransferase [Bacteroidota bacterium]
MNKQLYQASDSILLIRPATFSFNRETAISNAFQIDIDASEDSLKLRKLHEFDAMVNALELKGVKVIVIEDTVFPPKPDAVFPNNWATFHSDGTVILYPMCAANRRTERRPDIIEFLSKDFEIKKVLDFSKNENEGKYLEGTGSIIFDQVHKIGYACLSPRTNKSLFLEVCKYLNYTPVYFYAHDANGKEIYHTNVMMCIGEKFAAICLESITNMAEREKVKKSLTETGHIIIEISFSQMKNFAGNMLEVRSKSGRNILALSMSAYNALTYEQKTLIEKYCELVPLSIDTIETIGGGSARCMIAEIFLPAKRD